MRDRQFSTGHLMEHSGGITRALREYNWIVILANTEIEVISCLRLVSSFQSELIRRPTPVEREPSFVVTFLRTSLCTPFDTPVKFALNDQAEGIPPVKSLLSALIGSQTIDFLSKLGSFPSIVFERISREDSTTSQPIATEKRNSMGTVSCSLGATVERRRAS